GRPGACGKDSRVRRRVRAPAAWSGGARYISRRGAVIADGADSGGAPCSVTMASSLLSLRRVRDVIRGGPRRPRDGSRTTPITLGGYAHGREDDARPDSRSRRQVRAGEPEVSTGAADEPQGDHREAAQH